MPTLPLRRLLPMALLLPATLLNGCGPFNYLNKAEGTDINMAGAGTVLQDTDAYTPERLAAMINCGATNNVCDNGAQPSQPAATSSGTTPPDPVGPAMMNFSNQLAKAPSGGRASADELIANQNRLRDARNEIQGMLIAASNNRCTAFKQRLRQQASTTTFLLGSLATGLGAAGALFTNGTSQILSGAGAGTAGINAEYQRDILSNLTTNVIVPGIDKQRTSIAQEINNRRCLGITSYPLSLSLADVVRYHAACNLDVGVAAASSAVNKIHTQSIADVQAALAAFKDLKDSMNTPATTRKNTGKQKPQPSRTIAGTEGSESPMGSSSTDYGADSAAKAGAAGDKNQPLVGDSTALTECRPLDENGLLPPGDSTTGDTTGEKPIPNGHAKTAREAGTAGTVTRTAPSNFTASQYPAH